MAKIRDIAICAQEPFKLAEFYKSTFGMQEVARLEKSVFVTDGYINLALFPAEANGGQEGIYHFGFQVDDVEEIARKGKAADAQTGIAPRPRDGRYAEFRIHDPVRHRHRPGRGPGRRTRRPRSRSPRASRP